MTLVWGKPFTHPNGRVMVSLRNATEEHLDLLFCLDDLATQIFESKHAYLIVLNKEAVETYGATRVVALLNEEVVLDEVCVSRVWSHAVDDAFRQ